MSSILSALKKFMENLGSTPFYLTYQSSLTLAPRTQLSPFMNILASLNTMISYYEPLHQQTIHRVKTTRLTLNMMYVKAVSSNRRTNNVGPMLGVSTLQDKEVGGTFECSTDHSHVNHSRMNNIQTFE